MGYLPRAMSRTPCQSATAVSSTFFARREKSASFTRKASCGVTGRSAGLATDLADRHRLTQTQTAERTEGHPSREEAVRIRMASHPFIATATSSLTWSMLVWKAAFSWSSSSISITFSTPSLPSTQGTPTK